MKKIEQLVFSWPKLFAQSLKVKIPSQTISNLGCANLYWWRAYNIYDDILDTDKDSSLLPKANIYLFKCLSIFYNLGLQKDFYKRLMRLFSQVEKANIKELKDNNIHTSDNCFSRPKRLPKFKKTELADKSIALALSCVAVAYLSGMNNKKITATINFFKYYLSAKQLSDDAYDWLDDLKKGKMTLANVLVIKKCKNTGKPIMYSSTDLIAAFLRANPEIGARVKSMCEAANIEAQKIGLKKGSSFIGHTTRPLINSALKAITI